MSINIIFSTFYRAFWLFKRHFPAAGDSLYNSLDSAAQRAVDREGNSKGDGSRHGSSDSLHQVVAQQISAVPRGVYGVFCIILYEYFRFVHNRFIINDFFFRTKTLC